jgi:hypothetical protein
MTVKIAGQWERSWRAPLEEFSDWLHPLKEFNVNEFYMCPVTGIDKSRVIEHRNLDDVFAENPDLQRVYIDESATIELPDFEHPVDCIYVLGRTGYSPYITQKREGDLAVKIPSAANSGGFWGHQAAMLVLYDRFLKGQ